MKTINTKDMMKAHAEIVRVKSTRDFENRMARSGYGNEEKTAKAEEALKAAREAFWESAKTLTAAIKEEEGRANQRTITAEDIIERLYTIENGLNISKKSLEGVRVHVDENAQNFPKSYKYRAESTHFSAEYKAGSWRITGISREACLPATRKVSITLTEEARKAVIGRIENGIL